MSLDRFAVGYVEPKPSPPAKLHPIQPNSKHLAKEARKLAKNDAIFQRKMRRLDQIDAKFKSDAEYREKLIINADPKNRATIEMQSIPSIFRNVEYMISIGLGNKAALKVDVIKNLLVKNNISYSDKSGLQDEWAKLSARKLDILYNGAKGDTNTIIRIYKIIAARLPY